jgi:glucose-6-phosphate 1-dehydrogenase
VSGPAGDVLVLFGATGDLAHKMLWPASPTAARSTTRSAPCVTWSRTTCFRSWATC